MAFASAHCSAAANGVTASKRRNETLVTLPEGDIVVRRFGLDEVGEGAERRGQMTAAGVVEKRPRKALPPRFQHRHKCAAVQYGA